MEIAVFIALALLLYVFCIVWLMTHLRYQIGRREFKITLFGFPLRRVPLSNIESITKRRPAGLAENWVNTLHPSHRVLIVRLRRGWRRTLIITPKNRYVLKANLERALERIAAGDDATPSALEALEALETESPAAEEARDREEADHTEEQSKS